MTCDRCDAELRSYTTSLFNEDMLCFQCSEDEKTCPGYDRARQAEAAQTRVGRLNFPGVGLSAADRLHLGQVLAFRRDFPIKAGALVVLTQDVEQWPLGIFKRGLTGRLVTVRPDLIAVRLDVVHLVLKDWRNELQWYPDQVDYQVEDFLAHVSPVNQEVL